MKKIILFLSISFLSSHVLFAGIEVYSSKEAAYAECKRYAAANREGDGRCRAESFNNHDCNTFNINDQRVIDPVPAFTIHQNAKYGRNETNIVAFYCYADEICIHPNVYDDATATCKYKNCPSSTCKDNPQNKGKSSPETCNGNPCDASSGNKFQTEVDYTSSSIRFVRYYNSLDDFQSVLGKKWTHDYLGSLTINDTIRVNRPDGKVLKFINYGGSWKANHADITETLTAVGSQWKFKTADDSLEIYNDTGQLLTVTTRDEKITRYTYNANGLLEQVSDPYSRTLFFEYDSSGRLIVLTTPENTQVHYIYDDLSNNLISVIYPDNTPGDLSDNPTKIYHYENIKYPNHLTGITDENGVRFATWAYNSKGLVTLSEHANQAEKIEIAYDNYRKTTTVSDVQGHVKTYHFDTFLGTRKPTTVIHAYHDGQQMVTKSKSYSYYRDTGRLRSNIDFNENETFYKYNDRGLVTLKIRAKGKPEQDFIRTTWHPDFRLPETRTYPDRVETYSYDSKGQLISTQITTIE